MVEGTESIAFLKHFEEIEDPRQLWKVWHPLKEILLLTLCGVISGFTEFSDIELYGKERLAFLRQFLPFKAGIPSHDTLERFFRRLNPAAFQQCFVTWTSSLQQEIREIIAIDGKTLKGSFDADQPAIHMVSAWAEKNRLVLAQQKVEGKSNEITAIPKLLELLALKGAIVTIDAMGCQKGIAKQIVEQGGDYVLALKSNHPALYEDVRTFFEEQGKTSFRHSRADTCAALDKGHGRIEKRCYVSTSDVAWLQERHPEWQNLQSIIMVNSTRTLTGKQPTTETRYYISSLPQDAKQAAEAIQSHWGIENKLHWVLDVVFHDDASRVRKDHAPQNLHVMKQAALNLIRKVPSKRSLRAQRIQAGLNSDYLLKILQGQ